MATSTLLNTDEQAPEIPGGDNRTLGPSDSSDSGSDVAGAGTTDGMPDSDSDRAGTGERPSVERVADADAEDGNDIDVDQVIDPRLADDDTSQDQTT